MMDTTVPRCLVLKLTLHLVRNVDQVDYVGVGSWSTHASALFREQLIVAGINVRFNHRSDVFM
jgi:hypothetical protein